MATYSTNDNQFYNLNPSDTNNQLFEQLSLGCECQEMYEMDVQYLMDIYNVSEEEKDNVPNMLVELFESCPPTKQQAMKDIGRYIKQPSNTIMISDVECYVSGRPIEIQSLEITQQCCYSQPNGYAISN